MEGFLSIGGGVRLAWNEPFGAVRERLSTASGVRQVQEQGLRLIRFEETLPAAEEWDQVDLQNELYFNPDFGYGLRSASIRVEGVGGRPHVKHQGSYRPLVTAYLRLYRILAERYGEPAVRNHLNVDDPERLVRVLDHTRESMLVTAVWMGPEGEIHHELQVSFDPRHVLRFAAPSTRLVLRNETGKSGLRIDLTFPGGHTEAVLAAGAERSVEIPPGGRVVLEATLGKARVGAELDVEGAPRTVVVGRRWLTGTLVVR